MKEREVVGAAVPAFPVVLAAPRRFHLFCRDDDDAWAPTIDDINKGTYDALKLKRVSFYLDADLPYGNVMGFGFDGTLIIARNPHLRSADIAIDEFNRVLATCLLGGLPGEQVTARDLAFGKLMGTGYFRYETTHGATARLHQAFAERSAGSRLNIDLMMPHRINRSRVLEAFEAGNPIIQAIPRVNPATLLMAFSYYNSTEYRSSLIYTWVVVEQLVSQIWEDIFLRRPDSIIFQERVGSLNNAARNVSVKIEFLVQAKLIDRKLYRYLERARTARNSFIHSGKAPGQADAYFALAALIRLIGTICAVAGIATDTKALTAMLSGRRRGRGQVVMVAGDDDWSKVKWWSPVAPIPGEDRWEGDYETHTDIQLVSVPPNPA